jgi:release factor glutamine methyltransferase
MLSRSEHVVLFHGCCDLGLHFFLQERVPYQYLVATAHWRDLMLAVGPGILIPRPETEQMVDLAAAAVTDQPSLAAAHWLDLGTGSGAIAIATAKMLQKRCKVTMQLS